ncbi:MAG TPA: S24 family peptidase [Allosphingosinicella sp.]|nr:S24 family peptidase [Allosphingosinicella sp.]
MTTNDPRSTLDALVRARGDDYSSLSRLIGRNAAYIQQFIKRGVPKKLDEGDRRTLARYFGVDEAMLGAPVGAASVADPNRLVPIRRLEVGAAAGDGALVGEEAARSDIGFDERWLRGISSGRPSDLSLIKVQGDSMAPTLADGDDILIDGADAAERLRDGIYVLRREDTLLVKRLALSPSAGAASIRSDNPAYPEWPNVPLRDLRIIGRVVWAGRRIS